MAVDQAGQQPQTLGVDALRVGWHLHFGSRAAGGDVIVLDEHDRFAHDVAGRGIEERVAEDGDRCHGN